MPDLFKFKQKIDLNGFTLIIPSVSLGNIPQLTIDLLITSYGFEKTATLWHPAIISSVGGDPYESNSSELCTACEFYVNESLRLCLIQLRSTIDFKLTTKFFADLKNELLEYKLKNILILSSAFDYELHNVNSGKFYYVSNEGIETDMSNLNIKQLVPDANGKYVVNGSGYAVKLFEVLSGSMECTAIFKYASEGDNRPDALKTIEILRTYLDTLKAEPLNIRYPTSWKFVFGGPPPLGIY